MRPLEGRTLVAYWLIGCGIVAMVRLVARAPALLDNPAGWTAAAGPAIAILLGLVAAAQLLRSARGLLLAAAVLSAEAVGLSVGPLAYRLDVGPFLHLSAVSAHLGLRLGYGAHLLLIVGEGNRVPEGIALNLFAVAILCVLAGSSTAAGPRRVRR